MRLMNGHPLIYYAVSLALSCAKITDIAVTSDDEEVKHYIRTFDGVELIDRTPELAQDDTPLDPVIHDALLRMEMIRQVAYDVVITLQPTSPLLKKDTLEAAISMFLGSNADTIISVVNRPHLAWGGNRDNAYPLYLKRLNRQYLPNNFIETGAFLITKREHVHEDSRVGPIVNVCEIAAEESVDIDDYLDWVACETIFRKKRIVFRTDAHKLLGMGHVYNCLTLAYNMIEHDILFVCDKRHTVGIEKISASRFPYVTIGTDEEFFAILERNQTDVVVVDTLDTEALYIKKLKTLVPRVVTIEDLGSGIYYADAVINALYEEEHHLSSVYSGKDYVFLRDEFFTSKPKPFSSEINTVLVMFGGSDPANLTKKVYDAALALNESRKRKVTFLFAAGMAYDCEANGVYEAKNARILLFHDVKRVSHYMSQADLAFISQGRTIFEIASMGVPAVVIAQNEREQKHTFAQMANGFLNLGIDTSVTGDMIINTITWLEQTPRIRAEMRNSMLKNDLKSGIRRVKNIILGDY
jgi:spore coat polysaccharide biosynthesis predicted glycosyltransferase SpsG/CMP-N-acetylneuraminic acid synthetase